MFIPTFGAGGDMPMSDQSATSSNSNSGAIRGGVLNFSSGGGMNDTEKIILVFVAVGLLVYLKKG